jgi:hypothetical protein
MTLGQPNVALTVPVVVIPYECSKVLVVVVVSVSVNVIV